MNKLIKIQGIEEGEWKDLADDLKFDHGRSFGLGGYGIDGRWHVDEVWTDDNGQMRKKIYPLPMFISKMMSLQKEWSQAELKNEFKNLMSLK